MKVRYEGMSKEQYKGINDIVNDQGFARAISNAFNHLEVFWCERINTAKKKDGLTSVFYYTPVKVNTTPPPPTQDMWGYSGALQYNTTLFYYISHTQQSWFPGGVYINTLQ